MRLGSGLTAEIGNTLSTIAVTVGGHTVTVKKLGLTTWERKIKVTGGKIQISAHLQPSEGGTSQPAQWQALTQALNIPL